MKIEIMSESEKFREKSDFRSFYGIKVNGKQECFFIDGEPEDANLMRDFNDVLSIPDLMKKAYEAGKNREDLEMINVTYDKIP